MPTARLQNSSSSCTLNEASPSVRTVVLPMIGSGIKNFLNRGLPITTTYRDGVRQKALLHIKPVCDFI